MKIILYKDPSSRVEWEKLQSFLSEEGFSVTLREDLFLDYGRGGFQTRPYKSLDEKRIEALARRMAEIRVMGITEKNSLNPEPFQVEIDYEKRNLLREDRKVGPVYSGYHFQSLLREIIVGQSALGGLPILDLHLIFTNQRLATWGEDRWHLRTILLGFPSIISTTGLVEAPAREREYYLLKSFYPSLGEKWLKENPNHLEHDDPRLTEVIKGYLWQAIFYWMQMSRGVAPRRHAPTEEFSFCDNPDCSLYNSHWQREVLKAQLGGMLCKDHVEMKNKGFD